MTKKVAIVTGAAQGIGRTIALHLAKDGFYLVLTDVNEQTLCETKKLFNENGHDCSTYTVDVSCRKQVFEMVDDVAKKHKRLDVMVANAGVVQVKPFIEITEEDVKKLFEVNVYGTLYCMQAAAKQMIEQKSGKIITASSTSGKRAVEFLGHYAATKFAVIGLTQAAAKELAPYGITVNAYCPGIVGTSMWKQIDEQMATYLNVPVGKTFEEKINSIPLGRVQKPEDVAGLVSYLASNQSNYMTGQAIVIDGGNVFS